MADVFISYSRKDTAFARQLHAALVKREYEAWADWESIPLTAEWMVEIHSAIEAADAVIFIISPDSIGSSVCSKELDHALTLRKRLVPVVCRDVQASGVPRELAALNWVFMRDSDTFETAFDGLVTALQTDIEWVRAHTRLLVRAIEWDTAAKNTSFLLRGTDLSTAEQWLGRAAAGMEPGPTTLQSSFILASRKAETSRQHVLLMAVSFGLCLAVILGLLAWFQRDEAVHQTEVARQQARLALARQLGAQADGQLDARLDLASLLSVEANRLSDTRTVRQSLLSAVATNPRLGAFLRGHTGPITSVAFSADGARLASASRDGTIRLWDIVTGQLAADPLVHDDVAVLGVAFSPDGRLLASAGIDAVRVWDAADGTPSGLPIGPLGRSPSAFANSLSVSPDNRTLATANLVDGSIGLWDASTGLAMGPPIAAGGGTLETLAFSPDGHLLAAGGLDQLIRVWDVAAPHALRATMAGTDGMVMGVAFSPDGTRIASASSDSTIRQWDVGSGQQLGASIDQHAGATSVAYSPDGRRLVSGGTDNSVRLWDATTGAQLGGTMTGHSASVDSVAFSPSGALVASGSADGVAIVWHVPAEPLLARVLGSSGGAVDALSFSRDGELIAASDRAERSINIWGTWSGERLSGPPADASQPTRSLRFTAQGELLSATNDGSVRRWDVAQAAAISDRPADMAALASAFSPDGSRIAFAGVDGAVRLVDVMDGRLLLPPMQHGDTPVSTVAFSPDGKTVFSGGYDRNLRRWDAATGDPIGDPMKGHTAQILSLAVSPDGAQVASGSQDNTVRLWDTATGKSVGRPLVGAASPIFAVAFSPDGSSLASGGFDSNVIIWDVATGQPLGRPLSGVDGIVFSLAFSPDGQRLAAGVAGRVVVWDLDPESWLIRACERAGRNLTETEWRQYLGDRPDQPTCPSVLMLDARAAARAGDAAAAAALAQQSVRSAADSASGELDNRVCRLGAIEGFAQAVLPACDRAVAGRPAFGPYLDSRGIARARASDPRGAVEDLTAFVAWSHAHHAYVTQGSEREQWVAQIGAGGDPFDSLTLTQLAVTP